MIKFSFCYFFSLYYHIFLIYSYFIHITLVARYSSVDVLDLQTDLRGSILGFFGSNIYQSTTMILPRAKQYPKPGAEVVEEGQLRNPLSPLNFIFCLL